MITIKKLAAGVATGALAFAVMSSAAYAQETTGGINGTAKGANGSPLANAPVTVVYEPTNQTFTATTDANGLFSIRQLPPGGPYRVKVGDLTQEVPSVGLGSSLQLTISAEAPVADTGLSEVTVTASRSTSSQQVQTGPRSTFNAADIESLPTFSRDLRDVARLNPFVQLDPTNNNALIIAGNNNRFNAIYVDGVRQSDDFGLNANGYPTQRSPISIDLVQSLNVEIAPFDVQYGAFQGGVLNLTTKSGSNEFHGTASYEYDSRQLGAGEEIRDKPFIINFKDKDYSFTLGGPIIKDRVFFEFGYEKYEGLPVAGFGPVGSAFGNQVQGVTQGNVDQVTQTLQSVYGYNAGGVATPAPVESEKYFGKLTWQINDKHRFVFIAQSTDDTTFNQFSSATTLALGSTPYIFEQPLEAYSGYLYSNWTPNFSTEVSYTHRETDGITNNLGAPFPNFTISPNGVAGSAISQAPFIRVGQDISRQANLLLTTDQLFRAKGSYTFSFHGQHTLTAGYEHDELDIFNVFVQNAIGTYTFASLADLQARRAISLTYANAASNNANDGAAVWGDVVHTGYIQDEYRPLSNLTLRAGVRVEYYDQGDRPKVNPLIQQLYGISNTANLDGDVVVMPRVGFNWRPASGLVINGGLGLFSGGNPNVWVSNNYSNTGNLIGQVSCIPSSPAATCGNALTNVQGLAVNPTVLASNTASANRGTGITNLLDPKFQPPSVWKASLGGSYTANFADWAWTGFAGKYLGNDWRIHGDAVYQTVEDAVLWQDLQTLNSVSGSAPDGRPIFSPTRTGAVVPQLGGTAAAPVRPNTYDLLLTNTQKGHGVVAAVGLGKTFQNGLDFDVTYTYTDTKDVNPGTSSVALSNYRQLAYSDPNNPTLATSNYSIKNSVKAQVNYEKKFFGDYATRVRLYATRRSGLPYSFTFNSVVTNNYDQFGQAGAVASSQELFYVPKGDASGNVTLTSDPKVSYANGFDIASFSAFLKASGLSKYAGAITPRNAWTSRDVTLADLQVTQEIPAFFPTKAKAELYFQIFNLGNLLNNGWGVVEQIGFPYVSTVVTPTIIPCTSAQAVGCAAGQVSQYQYAKVAGRTTNFSTLPTINTSGQPPASLWALKLGVRYKF